MIEHEDVYTVHQKKILEEMYTVHNAPEGSKKIRSPVRTTFRHGDLRRALLQAGIDWRAMAVRRQ
jgi:hypothetical protein